MTDQYKVQWEGVSSRYNSENGADAMWVYIALDEDGIPITPRFFSADDPDWKSDSYPGYDDFELYAETEPLDYENQVDNDDISYDELKSEIIYQARQAGIPADWLGFFRDEPVHERTMEIDDNTLIRVYDSDVKNGTVELPESIKYICGGAFEGCESLRTITLSESVEEIGKYAFLDCRSLEVVNIFDGAKRKSIGESAFARCDCLKSIVIPSTVGDLGSRAFYKCGALENVVLHSDIINISKEAFCECKKLNSVILPQTIQYINSGAFSGCEALKQIVIPNSTSIIGDCAFQDCTALETINIPNGVRIIGHYAFDGCNSLKEVRLPRSVKSIGVDAFPPHTRVIREKLHSRDAR